MLIKVECDIYLVWLEIFQQFAFFFQVNLSVCPCVRVSVCSLLTYRLNVFLPPFPIVGCPIFLEIRNPWGKSNGKKWSQI